MNQQERSELMQSIGKFISGKLDPIVQRLYVAEEKATKAISIDIDSRIKLATIEAVKTITEQVQGELSQTKKEAEEATKKAIDTANSLRQPEDGKSVSIDEVKGLIQSEVKAQVSELPKPESGKDADPEIIKQMVAEEVAKIPPAKDGKDIDMTEVKQIISDMVSQIPPAKDGKSITVEEVTPLLATMVASTPAPEGTDPEIIKQMVAEEVAKINIPEPEKGQDGRDALQLEILPFIDSEKTYPRGCYAKHLGGLWRSFEQTHELRGWECIVNGISEHKIEQDGERKFVAVTVLSNGKEIRKEISIPVVIDRGVYKSEMEIKAGDGVTWAGSYWIAQKDNPIGKPGEPLSEGWRLTVKKGRDGKDGRNGIDKTLPVKVNQ